MAGITAASNPASGRSYSHPRRGSVLLAGPRRADQVRPGELKGGQHAEQEIVAEILTCTCMRAVRLKATLAWVIIHSGYTGQDVQQALKAVMGVLSDVERCWMRFWERLRKKS